MTNPTARAIASIAASAACGAIAWAAPDFVALAVLGLIGSMSMIWGKL